VSIKDLILTSGWPTLRGSRTVDPNQAWNEDAPATARLREHGAIILGKTATPEFGWKAVTDSSLTGITRNPWNPSKTPGGSSGGAAVAAAAGMGALAIGTDGGGSIRIPAGFTGIFGLKPSFGRVPAWPLSQFGTVSHLGPMTRTVEDAALMLNDEYDASRRSVNPVLVAHRQTIEALPQQLPFRHEPIHQCDEVRVVGRFDQMQHFMHQNVFEAFVRLLRDFRVETNRSRARIAASPFRLHLLNEDAIHPQTQARLPCLDQGR
jgi:Asp-tRNA(Asn)/Glu-tRNA(Gln) amidotransferase A subunit family amidase